jgi:glycerol-3-phosphate dehydrogenase
MARLYGAEADAVAARGADPLEPSGAFVTGEVDWAMEFEGAVTLEDVVFRRLRAALFAPAALDAALGPATERMGERLDWDADRCTREVEGVRARVAADLAFRFPGAATRESG